MKTKLIKKEQKFKPFTVEFTAETFEEARLLYHILNSGTLRDDIFKGEAYKGAKEKYLKECAIEITDKNLEIFVSIRNEITSQGFDI